MKYYVGNSVFDDFFKGNDFTGALKTDILEKDGLYQLNMEVPGINKEDIQIELKNGYLTVRASKNKEDNGKLIRQERFTGTATRSFFVGHKVDGSEIKANFTDGELKIVIPMEQKEVVKQIEIQ